MQTSDATPSRRARPLFGLRRRPGRLALAVFRLPLVLYRRGWGWMLGRTFMLLVHAGRTTGRPHPMTAMVMRYDPTSREVVIFSGWGPRSDWVRNLRARPALRVEVGRDAYRPQHRFLADDESDAVVIDFLQRHPQRARLACRILGWPDLRDEAARHDFVHTHPFVALRPAQPAAS
ncbi:nitroreductase/quinone reductase family protein [Puerhibacterium sp. TATVAM-FAB25]|uniref:nitroreductase/quinone reductase family protein n=1 Tax=Puerhibacterium sp. TATVAM-FAB25 TaxID=3093699 RepID=UPI00397A341E